MPWGWRIAAVLTPWFLLCPSSASSLGSALFFPVQDGFLPSVVPIAEIAPEAYVVWVQQHRNPSFSQILLERYPALGQRKWGGPPSRSLAVLPKPICGEEFGVWGSDPWQIPHYSVTSKTLSFYPDCLPKRFPLSDLISPTTRSPVWFCPWASSPSTTPRVKFVPGVDSEGASPAPAALCSGETPCLCPCSLPRLGWTGCSPLFRACVLQEAFPEALRRSAWPHCPL